MTLASEGGGFENVTMVDLSFGTNLYQWLWSPLGITYAEWRNGKPWKLPLMEEIRSAISAVRTKRNRDGTWRDAQSRLIPQLLVIDVRGRELKVENNKRKVMVNLPESMELMNWFLGELWQDLHPAAIADAPVAPGAPGGPADPATDSEKDDEADNREAFDKKVGEAVAKVVG